jgi:excisionase family DNA binding protein
MSPNRSKFLADTAAHDQPAPSATAPLLHTVTEAAEILRCHRQQVFKLIRKGKLQTAPKVSKHTLILRTSLLAFIESVAPTLPRVRSARRARLGSLAGLYELRI